MKFLKEDNKGVAIMSGVVEKMLMERSIERSIEIARRMLALGKYPLEEIANMCDLSLEEVKRLQNERTA